MRVPIESGSGNQEDPLSEELEFAKDVSKSKIKNQLAREKAENKKLKEDLSKLRDQMLRALADSDNLLKAKEKELASERKRLNKSLVTDLLQIIDSMDAAISSGNGSDTINTIRDQLISVLSRYGFRLIEAKGKRYDPFLHEVLGVSQEGEDGMIAEEIQKGYMLGDEVLRSSKVIVTKR